MEDVPAPAAAQYAATSGSVRQIVRQIGPWRLAGTLLFLVLAFAFARFSWNVVLSSDIERMLYDYRATFAAPRTGQDSRITMIAYDDQTLIETGRRSPLDRVILARALERIDRLGAKAIGIDILFDQATPEDATLIAAFRAMRTPTYIAFATNAANPEFMQVEQEDFLRSFLAQLRGSAVRPTSIMLASDRQDDVIRRWPEQPTTLPPLLPNALAQVHPEFRDYRGAVRFRLPEFVDTPVFNELTIQFLANPAIPDAVLAPQIEGRYVLIGGKIPGIDQFETPFSRVAGGTTAGLEVLAHLLAQKLDGHRFGAIPSWVLWITALIVVAAGAATSLLDLRPWAMALVLVLQLTSLAMLPFWLQQNGIDTLQLPVAGWTGGWILAFGAIGTAARSVNAEQRRFAQSALGKYLPVDVANEILRDPDQLQLHGTKREIYALFTDLEGFTKLSHAIEPEMVAFLLNRYLDMLCDVVLRHGGTIDKFVGDAVVAFWGAPIARPDDADRATAAAIEMYEAGERFRREAPEGVPPIGITRVGLHCGEAVVGNFGGKGRIQYTALGDSMNLAARLESANKQLKTRVLVSETAAERTEGVRFRPMGRVTVRGRTTPIAIFEPVPHISEENVTRLTALVAEFDQGVVQALEDLERYSGDHPEDAAIANLVYRLRKAGPGGSFVLD